MKLRSCLVAQPGLLVEKPWPFSGYVNRLGEGWELSAETLGVVARRDGGIWLVPWGRVMGCEVREEVATGGERLTASVGAVAGAGRAKR